MSKDNFEWTDELVREFVLFKSRFYVPDDNQLVEAFKKYKNGEDFLWASQPKTENKDKDGKDWEIVAFLSAHEDGVHFSYICYKDIWLNQKDWQAFFLKNEYKIHSVKRLSDGEVFSIGDRFSDNTAGHYSEHTITEFKVDGKRLEVLYGDGICFYTLVGLKKLPSPQESKPEKERIEVAITKAANCSPNTLWILPFGSYDIGVEKYSAIKQAIEQVLNDEQKEREVILYTPQQVDAMCEDAFVNGINWRMDFCYYPKYKEALEIMAKENKNNKP